MNLGEAMRHPDHDSLLAVFESLGLAARAIEQGEGEIGDSIALNSAFVSLDIATSLRRIADVLESKRELTLEDMVPTTDGLIAEGGRVAGLPKHPPLRS